MPQITRHSASIPPGETVQVSHTDFPYTKEIPSLLRRRASELAVHMRTLKRIEIGAQQLETMVTARNKRSHQDEALEELMWTAVLTEYARAFDPGGGGDPVPATVYDTAEEQRLHEFFMQQRSKHIAHDVNDWRNATIGVNLSAQGRPVSVSGAISQALFKEDDARNLISMVRKAHAAVNELLEAEVTSMLRTLNERSSAELLALPDLHVRGGTDNVKAARRPSRRQT